MPKQSKSPRLPVFSRSDIEDESALNIEPAPGIVGAWAELKLSNLPNGDPLRAVKDDAARLVREFTLLKRARLNVVDVIDGLRDQGVSWDNIGRILDCDGRSIRSWRLAWKPTRWPDL